MTKPRENPKAALGRLKPTYRYTPPSAVIALGEAMADGVRRNNYGPMNWRETGVELLDYTDAIQRHCDAMRDGEMFDRGSGLLHAAHIMGCCAVIIDALAVGKLTDNRFCAGTAGEIIAEYAAKGSPFLKS